MFVARESKFRKLLLFSSFVILLVACILPLLTVKIVVNAERHYLYCELLRPGLTRLQTQHALEQIGPYRAWEDSVLELTYVGFKSPLTAFLVGGTIRLDFDENDRLHSVYRQVGFGDWALAATCSEN